MYNRRLIITEDEKSRILNLHENKRKQEFKNFINEQLSPEMETQLNQLDDKTKNYFNSIFKLDPLYAQWNLKQNPSGKLLTGSNGVADGNKVNVKWYLVNPKEANGTNQTWATDNGQIFNVVKVGENFIGDSTSAAEGQTPAQAQPTFQNAPTAVDYGPDGNAASGTTPGTTPQTPASNPNAPQDTKAFQDWLDTNKPGWITGKPYKILEKKPERGYGKFGPLTQAAWGKYKNEFQPQQIPSSNTTLATATSANPTTATPTTPTTTTPSNVATTTNQVKLLDRVPTNKEIRQGFRRRKRVNNRMDRQKRKQLDDLYNQYEQIAGRIQKFGSRDDGSTEFKQQMATLENQVKNINAQIDKIEST